jgi:molybdenum cofactor cytidylyltransferase
MGLYAAMSEMPTVIVVASGVGAGWSEPLCADVAKAPGLLGATLSRVMGAGFPLVVVTTEAQAAEACDHVASCDVLVVAPQAPVPPDSRTERRGVHQLQGLGAAIAAGVMARPNAAGWLVLPVERSMVLPSTLLRVAHALVECPIAYAQHRGSQYCPVGFGAGLYSELIRLRDDEGARRLLARYPSCAVDVDDLGTPLDAAGVDALQDARAAWSGHASLKGRRSTDNPDTAQRNPALK